VSSLVIIGAGPTGLGAAYRLHELDHPDFVVLEARHAAGGLASSETTANGFTYDIGGHVLFSHFRYFDQLFDRILGDQYQELLREAWVWMEGRFLPYPFQNNIKHLKRETALACLLGLIEAQGARRPESYSNFEELIYGVFGKGMADAFMMPYNAKVWAHPPRLLNTTWIGERVPVVNIERVLGNVILDREDQSWGPNNTFKYPREGGTGGLFHRIAQQVRSRIRFDAEVVEVDPVRHTLTLADGGVEEYDRLISTMPLDLLVRKMRGVPETIARAADHLMHSGSAIVGVGIRQPCPTSKCWMYFPEDDCPFYRVTYLSNYSPEVVPDASTHYSLLAEVSRSPYKLENLETVVDRVLQGFLETRLLSPDDLRDVVDTHLIVREHTYPIPSLRRDDALAVIQPWLEERHIYSRGRFGAWKYEVGNMDHAVQMGVECVERLLNGRPEDCVHGRISPKDEQDLGLLADKTIDLTSRRILRRAGAAREEKSEAVASD
jgi:protoporphyrinogen oxidase